MWVLLLREERIFLFWIWFLDSFCSLSLPPAQDVAPWWREWDIAQQPCCDKWNRDKDDIETDHKSTQEIQPKYFLFSFFFFFSTTERALGQIWFGFSMNYHGLDPVSAVKAPKCPSCTNILPMNIQHLVLISPLFSHLYWYLTVCDNVLEEDVAKGSGIDIWSDMGFSDTLQWTQRSFRCVWSVRGWNSWKIQMPLIYYLGND